MLAIRSGLASSLLLVVVIGCGNPDSGGTATPRGSDEGLVFPALQYGEVRTARTVECGRAIEASTTGDEQDIAIHIHRDSVRIRAHVHSARRGLDLHPTDTFELKTDGTATKQRFSNLMPSEEGPQLARPGYRRTPAPRRSSTVRARMSCPSARRSPKYYD